MGCDMINKHTAFHKLSVFTYLIPDSRSNGFGMFDGFYQVPPHGINPDCAGTGDIPELDIIGIGGLSQPGAQNERIGNHKDILQIFTGTISCPERGFGPVDIF
jgi:hypothetical protein